MLILGLNAFHADSAACIIRDGRLLAAVEEERFVRTKHWAGFPKQSIAYCLDVARAKLDDVDAVAVNQNSRSHLLRKFGYVAARIPRPSLILRRLRQRRSREGIADLIAQSFPGHRLRAKLHHVDHHFAHLSSAFHVSPFEEAAVVSIDGFGDFSSAAWAVGSGSALHVRERVFYPHSLGIFYQALTQYLGFPNYGDEYKVMGLAPYGALSYDSHLSELVQCRPDGSFTLNLSYFRHHREDISDQGWDGSPLYPDLFTPALERLLGPRRRPDEPLEQRHKDIARSTQAGYETAFFNMLNAVQSRTGLSDVALAGGCSANSVANGLVRRRTGFRRVYVQAAAGDSGGALGAAYTVWHRQHAARGFVMDHARWGPEFSEGEISDLLDARSTDLRERGCVVQILGDEGALCRHTAAAVAQGLVVGWFQGRMEWGPRALGGRSIVCDPRRADMKRILNAKIKRREGFRPFAPSILEEAVGDWFEDDDPVPFMMQVYQIRPDKRSLIPAVAHVDGSGRLQTVGSRADPLYHKLICAFRDLTEVPMVLNTSFNENEPIVCRPDEALNCFLRTDMDVLVLGNALVRRRA